MLGPRVFSSLTCKENLQLLRKVLFQNSDLDDSKFKQLCKSLVKDKHCFATHRIDVGESSTPFRVGLKPDDKLQTKRPMKFLFIIKTN